MKHFLVLILVGMASLTACSRDEKPAGSRKVCLNMIVKNESQVIERCLTSVLPIIDYWIIVDTGSTDGTQEIIKNFMKKKGIAGELHERPWKNFGHNRNEALQLAKGKANYTLFIDADEYLVYEPGFKLPSLDKDFYYVIIHHAESRYHRVQFIKDALDWSWKGVLHEYVSAPNAVTSETVDHVYNMYTTEGARSRDPQKYLKDAQLLEAGLKEEPNNSRYVFYLAQSYKDAGDPANALKYYEKRAAMGGWDQEVFWSLYQVGCAEENLGLPKERVVGSYTKAYQFRPSRLEPLYQLAHYFLITGDFQSGYAAGIIAQSIPSPQDLLFVQQWMHEYGALLDLSICAYWIGKYDECQKISLELLKRNLPENVRTCVQNNLGFANAKLLESQLTGTK
jgi:glycosyltransferase involved in cell wall biosynthesis